MRVEFSTQKLSEGVWKWAELISWEQCFKRHVHIVSSKTNAIIDRNKAELNKNPHSQSDKKKMKKNLLMADLQISRNARQNQKVIL